MGQTITPIAQMTMKAIGGEPRRAVKEGKQVFCARIFGEATATKTKEARNGDPYSYLIGMFRAERPAATDDEKKQGPTVIFESEKLFLPGILQEKLEALLATSNGKPVQFGYDIFANPDDKVTAGYRYAAQAVLETATADRLAAISGELSAKPLPGTAAPKSDAKTDGKKK